MIRTTVEDAQERLKELIDAALRGEEVVITTDPMNNAEEHRAVRLYAVESEAQRRPQFGSAKGLIWMSDDFDEPLEEFEESMR